MWNASLWSPAAVPSGHVAFALIAGGVFARMGDMAWLRAFGWVYAPFVVAVTVVTANHLLLDAVAAVERAIRASPPRSGATPRGRRMR